MDGVIKTRRVYRLEECITYVVVRVYSHFEVVYAGTNESKAKEVYKELNPRQREIQIWIYGKRILQLEETTANHWVTEIGEENE